MKKHLGYILLGALIGMAIVVASYVVSTIFNIKSEYITNFLVIVGLIILVVGFIYNMIYVSKYRKRTYQQIELLNNHQADLALKDMQDMYHELEKKGPKNLLQLVKLNMSAAHCDLKEYDKALNLLLEISDNDLATNERFIHQLNICACYFYLDRAQEAVAIYEQNEKLFDKFRENKIYGGNVAVITIFVLLAKNEKAKAKKLYEESRKKWHNPRLDDDFAYIEKQIKTN